MIGPFPHHERPRPDRASLHVDYLLLLVSVLLFASSLTGVMLLLVNNVSSLGLLAFSLSLLLVSLPATFTLASRLGKIEQFSPHDLYAPFQQQASRIGQVLSYIALLSSCSAFVFLIFLRIGGQLSISFWQIGMNALCPLAIFGAVYCYYRLTDRAHGDRA